MFDRGPGVNSADLTDRDLRPLGRLRARVRIRGRWAGGVQARPRTYAVLARRHDCRGRYGTQCVPTFRPFRRVPAHGPHGPHNDAPSGRQRDGHLHRGAGDSSGSPRWGGLHGGGQRTRRTARHRKARCRSSGPSGIIASTGRMHRNRHGRPCVASSPRGDVESQRPILPAYRSRSRTPGRRNGQRAITRGALPSPPRNAADRRGVQDEDLMSGRSGTASSRTLRIVSRSSGVTCTL